MTTEEPISDSEEFDESESDYSEEDEEEQDGGDYSSDEESDNDDEPVEEEQIEQDEESEDAEEGDEFEGDEDEPIPSQSKVCHVKDLEKDQIPTYDDDSVSYAQLPLVKIPKDKRRSGNNMTYYELVRLLGVRTRQIELGAQPLFKVDNFVLTEPQKAYIELMLGTTPFIILRYLPGKTYEEWEVSELNIYHSIEEKMFIPQGLDLRKLFEDNGIKGRKVMIDDSGRNYIVVNE